jgi:hypothetical protein
VPLAFTAPMLMGAQRHAVPRGTCPGTVPGRVRKGLGAAAGAAAADSRIRVALFHLEGVTATAARDRIRLLMAKPDAWIEST